MLYEVGLPATIAHVLTRQFHSVRACRTWRRSPVPSITSHCTVQEPRCSCWRTRTIARVAMSFPLKCIGSCMRWAQEHGLKLHLDGARLFNAVVASGVSARGVSRPARTR